MTNPAMNDYKSRALTEADAPAATDLVNTCYIAETGAPVVTKEEVLGEWRTPGFHLATDSLGVLTPDDRLIGMLEMWNLGEPPVRPLLFARVHPDYCSQGIGSSMIEWAEDWSQTAVENAPDGARVTLRSSTNVVNEAAAQLLANSNFSVVRHFYRMVVELDAPPPEPVWPEGLMVETFVDTEANHRTMYAVMEEAFADHWGHLPITFDKWMHWTETDPQYDPSLWFWVRNGDEIAAGELCRFKMTEDPGLGWIDDLAVRRPYRKRGLGQALLLHAFGELYRRGQRKVGLGVDASSLTGATRLYEKVGMEVVRQIVLYEKELRPGAELSTQTIDD
ncbi:MAG: GNAT family N-acetyltransferase [Chloroflexi bacterium]|nr:GNAT family N-acetyltransferase [Chloroflexota bacterium]